jgi:ABC-type antimicrobial peptide transport system permease subunit
VPLGGESLVHSFHPAGRSDIPGTRPWVYSVGPRYFRTMGISLIDGREFLPTDNEERPAAVIVNETFARTYFPGQNALGRMVQTGGEADAEIVGVVSDSRIDTIGEAPKSVLYYAWAQRPRRLVVHARTASPAAAITAVQRAIGEVDALADVTVTTRSEAASLELTMRRTGTLIVGAIGVVGLMLTVIGLYGVVAYMVASRTVEIGIRMALGATPGRLRGEVLWYAVRLAAVGVALGTGATVFLAAALATFFAGFSAIDLVAYGATVMLVIGASLGASYVPARRILRVDPMISLRQS